VAGGRTGAGSCGEQPGRVLLQRGKHPPEPWCLVKPWCLSTTQGEGFLPKPTSSCPTFVLTSSMAGRGKTAGLRFWACGGTSLPSLRSSAKPSRLGTGAGANAPPEAEEPLGTQPERSGTFTGIIGQPEPGGCCKCHLCGEEDRGWPPRCGSSVLLSGRSGERRRRN